MNSIRKYLWIIMALLAFAPGIAVAQYTHIMGPDGTVATVAPNGAQDFLWNDQTTKAVMLPFGQVLSTTTLAAAGVLDAYSLTLTDASAFTTGNLVVLFDTAAERLYFGESLSIAGGVVTLDTPLNFAYTTATSVVADATIDLNVDGSVTRQTFAVTPPIGVEIDVTQVIIQMTTSSFPLMTDLGDIDGGVARGIVLRAVNGTTTNYFTAKTNAQLAQRTFLMDIFVNGVTICYKFAGPGNAGVAIRLGQGESLELIVSDNFNITGCRAYIIGHLVTSSD